MKPARAASAPDSPSAARSSGSITRIDRPRSLTAIVAEQIRELIVSGGLALGEQLSEQSLAEQLGVSRMPVREAFLHLQSERLVDVRPQRGSFVFDYDVTELREICELRQVLEIGALQVAIKFDRAGLVRSLRACVKQAEALVIDDVIDPLAYQAMDTLFHDSLIQATENRELIEAYTKISGRIRAIRHRLMRSPRQSAESQAQHSRIVEAIAASNDALAAGELAQHVFNSYRMFSDASRPGAIQPNLKS